MLFKKYWYFPRVCVTQIRGKHANLGEANKSLDSIYSFQVFLIKYS